MKVGSKRRRSKAQIQEEKNQDYKRKALIEDKLKAFDDMAKQVQKMNRQLSTQTAKLAAVD